MKVRIRALTERTIARGCTEAEAMMAAEMVGRLLERYALTMEEVDLRQEPCVQVEVPVGGQRRRPVDMCVPALARFCDCKVWLARTEQQLHYVFFGFETDVGLAAYLFAVIARSIQTEVTGFRKAKATLAGIALRRASTSFQGGMAVRVGERLTAMHAEREAAVAAQRPAGTSLMLVPPSGRRRSLPGQEDAAAIHAWSDTAAECGLPGGAGCGRAGQPAPPDRGTRDWDAALISDRQRARVYAWEDRVIGPQDPSMVPFPAAQGMVDAIWSEMGLLYPPRAERLPGQGALPTGRCQPPDDPVAAIHAVLVPAARSRSRDDDDATTGTRTATARRLSASTCNCWRATCALTAPRFATA